MSVPVHLDESAIRRALTPAAAVGAIERTLRAGFDPTTDPARVAVPTVHGQLLLMPSEAGRYAGVKVATVTPDNPARGLPRIQASYLLLDASTLSLVATLDGTALTTLRTPAVAVAAARPALDRFGDGLRVVGFGAGPQGVGHVDTLAGVTDRALTAVTFVVRDPGRAAADATQRGAVLAAGSAQAAAALAEADVVVCATSARSPLFEAAGVKEPCLVLAVGSHEPGARELPAGVLAGADVVVEDRDTALREAGDVVMAIDEGAITATDLLPMSDVVSGRVHLTRPRTVVKTVGMAWQDLAVAAAVWESARR